jgi:hypothetical protein
VIPVTDVCERKRIRAPADSAVLQLLYLLIDNNAAVTTPPRIITKQPPQ